MTKPVFTLRVFHPSIDPQVITEEFGLPPNRTWRAGEPRATSKGHPLAGQNRQTFWRLTLGGNESGNNDLRTGLRDIVNRLEPYRVFFKRIRGGGGRVEIFVAWFLERHEGLELDHELMEKFAALEIDLSFDVYPPETQQD
jgi:hypothetical protein